MGNTVLRYETLVCDRKELHSDRYLRPDQRDLTIRYLSPMESGTHFILLTQKVSYSVSRNRSTCRIERSFHEREVQVNNSLINLVISSQGTLSKQQLEVFKVRIDQQFHVTPIPDEPRVYRIGRIAWLSHQRTLYKSPL